MKRSTHLILAYLSIGFLLTFIPSIASAQYTITNLVSNQSGHGRHVDPNLVNAWGLTFTPRGPFFVADAGVGLATVYTPQGVPQKGVVMIPSAGGRGAGSPAGIVHNGSQEFRVGGAAATFLFGTLDGTISGWSPANGREAIIAINNSGKGASYNGLGITSKASGNLLYAPDFSNNRVDVFDGAFKLVASLVDASIPKGFVPFNVQDIGGKVYVAYASSNSNQSGGFIDIFSEAGKLVKHFAHGKPLNQPWGFAVAPKNFGPLSNTLLISNNTNAGTINGFDLNTGKFVGTIKDAAGRPIKIGQLWGIQFGGGTSVNGNADHLFFAAGPDNNADGLFGVIEAR